MHAVLQNGKAQKNSEAINDVMILQPLQIVMNTRPEVMQHAPCLADLNCCIVGHGHHLLLVCLGVQSALHAEALAK